MTSHGPYQIKSTRPYAVFDSFTVLLPSLPGRRACWRSIESILHQLGPNDQLVLIDAGVTTDETVLLASAADQDHRIHLVHQARPDAASAWNSGLSFATGAYVIFFSGDAVLLPGSLDAYRRSILHNRNPDLISGGHLFALPGASPLRPTPWMNNLFRSQTHGLRFTGAIGVHIQAAAFRRSVVKESPFPTDLSYRCELPLLVEVVARNHSAVLERTISSSTGVDGRDAFVVPALKDIQVVTEWALGRSADVPAAAKWPLIMGVLLDAYARAVVSGKPGEGLALLTKVTFRHPLRVLRCCALFCFRSLRTRCANVSTIVDGQTTQSSPGNGADSSTKAVRIKHH